MDRYRVRECHFLGSLGHNDDCHDWQFRERHSHHRHFHGEAGG
jgi:hypothetical protein